MARCPAPLAAEHPPQHPLQQPQAAQHPPQHPPQHPQAAQHPPQRLPHVRHEGQVGVKPGREADAPGRLHLQRPGAARRQGGNLTQVGCRLQAGWAGGRSARKPLLGQGARQDARACAGRRGSGRQAEARRRATQHAASWQCSLHHRLAHYRPLGLTSSTNRSICARCASSSWPSRRQWKP